MLMYLIRLALQAVAKDLFKVLKEKHGTNLQKFLSEKVTPVAGDITFEDLGLQDPSLKAEMLRDIDVVVNIAATTNFDERLYTYYIRRLNKICLALKMKDFVG